MGRTKKMKRKEDGKNEKNEEDLVDEKDVAGWLVGWPASSLVR